MATIEMHEGINFKGADIELNIDTTLTFAAITEERGGVVVKGDKILGTKFRNMTVVPDTFSKVYPIQIYFVLAKVLISMFYNIN